MNAATGDQNTYYGYGTTLATSDVARNDVLSSVTFAEGGVVAYTVNRQSQAKQFTGGGKRCQEPLCVLCRCLFPFAAFFRPT